MVEESLLGEDWTAALTANFLAMDEPMTTSSASSSSSTAAPSSGGRPAQGNTTTDRRLRFKSLITPFAGLFQWLKVPPNANHNDWIYNQHLPHLYNMHAILGNCEEFCRLALESTDDVSFPSLDKWIERLLDRLRQYSFRPKDGEKPRVVLILSDIDKQVTKLQKKVSPYFLNRESFYRELTRHLPPPPTFGRLQRTHSKRPRWSPRSSTGRVPMSFSCMTSKYSDARVSRIFQSICIR